MIHAESLQNARLGVKERGAIARLAAAGASAVLLAGILMSAPGQASVGTCPTNPNHDVI